MNQPPPTPLQSDSHGRGAAPDAGSIWARAAVVATLLGLASATFVYFGMRSVSHAISFAAALREGLTDWGFWVLVAPAVFAVARRFRIDRRRWLAVAALHLALGSTLALVGIGVSVGVGHWVDPDPAQSLGSLYHRRVLLNFHYAFMIYWMLVAAAHAYLYYHEAREAAELREQLARAQLDVLRVQLQPHFLFNTLHTIATLARARQTDTAVGMISGLAELLRSSLRQEANEVSLREELELLRVYLDIEQQRFADRLRVSFDVPADTLSAQVPSLILQPLVENAIRHGIGRRAEASGIAIVAARVNGALALEVRDDGPGFDDPAKPRSHGIGLTNARQRLGRLYGAEHRLETGNLPGAGAFVRLSIPWHTAGQSAGAAG